MSLTEINRQRRAIRQEWKRLTEKLAVLIERNEELDEEERKLKEGEGEQCAS